MTFPEAVPVKPFGRAMNVSPAVAQMTLLMICVAGFPAPWATAMPVSLRRLPGDVKRRRRRRISVVGTP